MHRFSTTEQRKNKTGAKKIYENLLYTSIHTYINSYMYMCIMLTVHRSPFKPLSTKSKTIRNYCYAQISKKWRHKHVFSNQLFLKTWISSFKSIFISCFLTSTFIVVLRSISLFVAFFKLFLSVSLCLFFSRLHERACKWE